MRANCFLPMSGRLRAGSGPVKGEVDMTTWRWADMRPWEQNVVIWGATLAGNLAIALTFGSDRQAAARIKPAQGR
jgi:hypothetical protein